MKRTTLWETTAEDRINIFRHKFHVMRKRTLTAAPMRICCIRNYDPIRPTPAAVEPENPVSKEDAAVRRWFINVPHASKAQYIVIGGCVMPF